ncbi:MAG: hypothetical protein AAF391_08205 [Bacteroidota bacterium]
MNACWYISTPPTTDPVTAAELRAALKITDSSFDSTTIDRLVPAATRVVEDDLDRSLITRTITGKLDRWPSGGIIYLPKPPFVSITSLSYIDTDGDPVTLTENTHYEFKNSGDSGRLVVAPGTSWPSVKSDKKEVITIVYTAGYGAASDVPADIKQAIIALASKMYNPAMDDYLYKVSIGLNRAPQFNYHIND